MYPARISHAFLFADVRPRHRARRGQRRKEKELERATSMCGHVSHGRPRPKSMFFFFRGTLAGEKKKGDAEDDDPDRIAFGTSYHFASWHELPLHFMARVATSLLGASLTFGPRWVPAAMPQVAGPPAQCLQSYRPHELPLRETWLVKPISREKERRRHSYICCNFLDV